ncbi:hypothetical protein ACFYT4_30930 [Streptomyces sp. NPDC004609]|uniref:hypothetical protein n=1 Tax=Streptomyces sp. NPDC004609 TaxID=3364704 RepID=UPI0036A79E1D
MEKEVDNERGTIYGIDENLGEYQLRSLLLPGATHGADADLIGACAHRAMRVFCDRYPRIPTLWAAHIHAGA